MQASTPYLGHHAATVMGAHTMHDKHQVADRVQPYTLTHTIHRVDQLATMNSEVHHHQHNGF